jgi:hypothetical protein
MVTTAHVWLSLPRVEPRHGAWQQTTKSGTASQPSWNQPRSASSRRFATRTQSTGPPMRQYRVPKAYPARCQPVASLTGTAGAKHQDVLKNLYILYAVLGREGLLGPSLIKLLGAVEGEGAKRKWSGVWSVQGLHSGSDLPCMPWM